ncbi:hypothetical protein [Allofranklinella schreckenbergeri]|uniref:hypothetical protein n=1 Tax=Allofranklinella schreckenbergeri TaxID=1076744 RepID=UPI0011C4AB5E|nr:hypothetical protein [Allofranklinella schreckenbergeri]
MKKKVLSHWMFAALPAVALMAACGGGGGSGGTGPGGGNTSKTEISLRAEKSELPLNLAKLQPGVIWNYSGTGRNSPYTTSLTVEAKVDGRFIPSSGDKDVFSCALDGAGIEVGALYYLDGKEDHQVEVDTADGKKVKVPGAYRAIALPSFGGMATFHFHATDATAGEATISCSYTDPRDNQERTAATKIRVGPKEANNTSPSVDYIESTSTGNVGYLHTQGSQNNTQLLLNVKVWNDLDQPVANPPAGVSNLYARIVGSYNDASRVAKLRGVGPTVSGGTGSTIAVSTISGLATFSVTSGQYEGPILIEFIADRADNNVSNGIVEPVSNLIVVYALHEPPPSFIPPLSILPDQQLKGYYMQRFMGALTLNGSGLPPHTWRLINGSTLPDGLTLQPNGVITGVPTRLVKDHTFMVAVVDSTNKYAPWRSNQVATGSAVISIEESPFTPHIAECGNGTDVCELKSPAVVGSDFVYLFTGAGGDGHYTWDSVPESSEDKKIHGFLTFDKEKAKLFAKGTDIKRWLLACTKGESKPGEQGKPDEETPTKYEDKMYDLTIRVTSAGIIKNQVVRVRVTEPDQPDHIEECESKPIS